MDWQAIGVALAACMTAFGAIVTGIYTGRNSRKKDLEDAKLRREQSEETASKARIEAVAADAADVRRRLRETEDEYDKEIRALRRDVQRGWDLARLYFGIMSTLSHLLNNIIMAESMMGTTRNTEQLRDTIKDAAHRLKSVDIPKTLEEPLP